MDRKDCRVDILLFDFGGVLAEEGFANGLREIGRRNGFDPEEFFDIGRDLVHETGYVTGSCREAAYWEELRARTGIKGSNAEFRQEILSRFIPRPWIFEIVDSARGAGLKTGILSDQTNWLDELDAAHNVYRHFDCVFNSYKTGKSKKDPSWFADVVAILDAEPGRMLFIDDNEGNCKRAKKAGINAIHFTGREQFLDELSRYCHPRFFSPSKRSRD